MRTDDILLFLKSLGLSEYEARVYSALSMAGTIRASEVSKASGVPQSKIYWVLDELIEKQLVEVSEGKPKDFRAVPAEVALRRLIEEKEKSVTDAKTGLKEITGYLKPAKSAEAAGGIWTVRGRNWLEFFNKASEMIERSRKYVYGVTRDYSRSARLSEVVERAVRRGVKVRVIGMQEVGEENFFKARWYADHGAELRTIETTLHPRIVVMDGREVLLRLDHDHEAKEGFPFSSVWSEDPGLVKVFDTYVRSVWDKASGVDLKGLERRMTGQ